MIPPVCQGLTDQRNCEKVLQYCDPNDSEYRCNARLIYLHLSHGHNYGLFEGLYKIPINMGQDVGHMLKVAGDIITFIF